jgi:hypothetical protein
LKRRSCGAALADKHGIASVASRSIRARHREGHGVAAAVGNGESEA